MRENEEKGAKKEKKKRSQADKVGKFFYLNKKVDRVAKEVKKLRSEQEARYKVLFNSLRPLLAEVDSEYIMDVVCEDEADEVLLDYMRSKGDLGITPTEASTVKDLRKFKFKPYHVTRRIQRMNRRLHKEWGRM